MRVPGPSVISDSLRYGFAVGKVRVLETRVLGRATYERLLDASSFEEQRRILSDTQYGRYLDGAHSASDVERGLEEALDGFYGFLDEAKLPQEVVRFFRVRHDYANLKAKMKAEALGEPLGGMISNLAVTRPEAFQGGPGNLPPFLGETYERAKTPSQFGASAAEATARREDLAEIDARVDRRMFEDLLATATDSKSDFLRGLARLMIDIANLKSVLRAKRRNAPAAEVMRLLVEGGALEPRRIAELYPLPVEAIAEAASQAPSLRGVPAAELVDPARLDVVADDLVVRYLREARLVPVGVEPVIAYVMAREAEVVALRVLLIGKLAGVSSEALRARLRDMYV